MPDDRPSFVPFTVPPDTENGVGSNYAHGVSARFYGAGHGRLPATLILAHGAGAGQQSAFMAGVARGLSARGVDIVTFDFPYMEARRRLPDRPALLEATWRAVIRTTRARPEQAGHALFVGGKSMGSRIASQIAAAPGLAVDGLVLLGYPLHPPNRPDQRRDAHLTHIDAPMLFVQGERDAFGSAAEMRALVAGLPRAELYLVQDANHSLEPPKRVGTDREAVLAAVQDHVTAWIRRVLGIS